MLLKPEKIRSKKIRDSAKGEPCTLRIPGICNGNKETTVFAHVAGNKGTATKNHDLFGVYACSDCHDWLDGRRRLTGEYTGLVNRQAEILRALQETLIKLYQKDLITIT